MAELSIGRSLRLWIPVALVTGLLSGLAAAAFFWLLTVATRYLLVELTGYHPAELASDGGAPAIGSPHWLVLPLLVAAGALVATVLVLRVAPETSGHGTDAAIHAAHHDPTGMRARVPAVKMLASAILIGSGGSAGSEGPIAQITAALGSIVARVSRLKPEQARITVSVGLASGVGAIFRSPLAGALLGAELLYRADIAAAVIVPALISSAVAFGVFGLFHGFDPLFGMVDGVTGADPLLWLALPLIGVLAGLLARLYAVVFYGTAAVFASRLVTRTLRIPRLLRPAIGGLLVGVIGLAIPDILGTSYGTAQHMLDGRALLGMSLWLVLAIPLVKILTTSLSVASGGSGGIFGPGLVIGGTAGAALWRLLEPYGLATESPVPFVLVGMAACLGSIIHAPLALTVMVAETTGSTAVLLPAMAATALAALIVGDSTLYRSQLRDRSESGLPEPTSVGPASTESTPDKPLAIRVIDGRPLEGQPVDGHVVAGRSDEIRTAGSVPPARTPAEWPETDRAT
ncbi:chloride channel protein [Solwaraspora sp. WMMD406]|uniref:chloride channel protein n=1 Tax=Solwaraspora sp. WMMD406 TaxID=3016095 RepID=UPI002417C26B|nr:chloride channel protein [Solwaraspora sp. WMMD406]MDG4767825.1 chloride channel protein [Solwaraspora sp. WMMD406]